MAPNRRSPLARLALSMTSRPAHVSANERHVRGCGCGDHEGGHDHDGGEHDRAHDHDGGERDRARDHGDDDDP